MQLIKQNLKILIVSPSNIALDTIAERVIEEKNEGNLQYELTRIGQPARMIESVLEISIDRQLESKYSFLKKMNGLKAYLKFVQDPLEKLRIKEVIKKLNIERKELALKILRSSNAIFATTVGAKDKDIQALLEDGNQNYFDVVILDEAGQSLEAGCLISILLAKK